MIMPGPIDAAGGAFARDIHSQDDLPRDVSPFVELGATGLRQYSGYTFEELLKELQGPQGRIVIREMIDGDAVVGAVLFAIEQMLRQVDWGVEAPSKSSADQQNADFLSGVLFDDQSQSWQETLSEILSFLPWGWSYFELVWKQRNGQNPKPEQDERGRPVEPAKSRFDDGRIGLRKMAIRAQETLLHWVADDSGSIHGLVQMPPPTYHHRTIPIEKALLFRTTNRKGNPEGRSLLRNAYEAWYMKRHIQRYEGIGVARDLAGIPVAWAPVEVLTASPGTREAAVRDEMKKILRQVHRDEQEGILWPLAYDPTTHQKVYDLTLLSSGGTRQFDTDKIIQRYDQRIATSVLADFLLLGARGAGSLALARTKTNFFSVAMMTVLDSICDVLNRHFVPRLFELNGMKIDKLPVVTHSRISEIPLEEVASYLTALAGAGMALFPSEDGELEKWSLAQIDAPNENVNSAQARTNTAPEPPGGPEGRAEGDAGQGDAAGQQAPENAPAGPQNANGQAAVQAQAAAARATGQRAAARTRTRQGMRDANAASEDD